MFILVQRRTTAGWVGLSPPPAGGRGAMDNDILASVLGETLDFQLDYGDDANNGPDSPGSPAGNDDERIQKKKERRKDDEN